MPAAAQTAWDANAFIGVVSVHAPPDEGWQTYDRWFSTVHGGVQVGRYLTPHLKLELEVAASGTGRQFVQRTIAVPGFPAPYPITAENETALRWVGAHATWQFFDNEWVHPFVSAGLGAAIDRRSVHTWEQQYYPRPPGDDLVVVPENRSGPQTTTALHGVFGGGVKLYMTRRAFFRTDARVSLGRSRQHLAFRAGVGVDF